MPAQHSPATHSSATRSSASQNQTGPTGSHARTHSPNARGAARVTHAQEVGSRGGGHLSVVGVSKQYADRRVLTDISFTAQPGDRIGLIGENGTGKSTLLRILAGVEDPDTGSVTHAESVGALAQELAYADDAPVSRVLDDAQHDALGALERIEESTRLLSLTPESTEAADAYSEALEAAERAGAWEAEARRGDVLAGLGLTGIRPDHPVGELSGGQRLRLGLAALLLEAPHTLLLDEPSNHLDDASAAYLERVLIGWPGIVIVASHDRTLLDAVTTRILDLDPLPVTAAELADAGDPEHAADPAGDAASAMRASRPVAADASTSAMRGYTNPAPISHDADDATDDPGSGFGIRVWGVGYSAARAARRAELARWRERYNAESEERTALRHEIEVGSREVNRKHESKSEAKITRKFYADKDARVTARRARNARVRLEDLERDRVRRPPEPLRFAGIATRRAEPGPEPEPAAQTASAASAAPRDPRDARDPHTPATLLRADRVGLSGRLAPVSLSVEEGGRILLTGPNGSGKSTLLTILASAGASGTRSAQAHDLIGTTAPAIPDTGTVERDPAARIGYLPQEVAFAEPARSAERFYEASVGSSVAEERPLAATGLIAARDLDRAVGSLSVGQRRRLALATLIADPPELLLLDEPTNHLSLTLVEELEEALRDFEGALVVATHDRWLRSRWEGAMLNFDAANFEKRKNEF